MKKNDDPDFRMDDDDWHMVKEYCHFLEPLAYFSTIMSANKTVTSSYVLPAYHALLDHFQESEQAGGLLAEAADAGYRKIDKYYTQCDSTLLLATILDPRFNLTYFANVVHNFVDTATVRGLFEAKFSEYSQKLGKAVESSAKASHPFRSKMFNNNFPKKTSNECSQYLNLDRLDEETDPLDWWKCHVTQFPVVAAMARDYLAISGSSVEPERKFSGAARTMNERFKLGAAAMRATQCLKNWASFFTQDNIK